MAKTALIAGASGLVGGHVLKILLGDPGFERVISVGRRKLSTQHPKLEQVVLDFEKMEEQGASLKADDFFCCLGTTIKKAGSKQAFRKVDRDYPLKLAGLAASCRAGCFSIVTALGSDAASPIFYNRVKGEVERGLEAVNIPSISILQPSLLLGERAEGRMGERIGQVVMKFASGIMKGPLGKYKAIEGSQVARAMVAIAKQGKKGMTRYPNALLLEY